MAKYTISNGIARIEVNNGVLEEIRLRIIPSCYVEVHVPWKVGNEVIKEIGTGEKNIDGATNSRDARYSVSSEMVALIFDDRIQKINKEAFNELKIRKIHIPSSCTEIPDMCFNECFNLSEITGIENVTRIGKCAFQKCKSLTSFDFSNVIEIYAGAFGYAGLEEVDLSSSPVELIDQLAFWHVPAKSCDYPNNCAVWLPVFCPEEDPAEWRNLQLGSRRK